MVQQRENFYSNITVFLFIIISIACFIIAYTLGKKTGLKSILDHPEYFILLLLLIPTWFVLLKIFGLSRLDRLRSYSIQFIAFLGVVSIGTSFLLFYVFIFKISGVSRLFLLMFSIFNLLALYATKVGILMLVKKMRAKGLNTRNLVLIVDDSSADIIEKFIKRDFWGYKIHLILTDSEAITEKYTISHSVLPITVPIDKLIENEPIDEVIYCCQDFSQSDLKNIIYSCQEIGVTFRLQSQFHSMVASHSYISYLDEDPFFTFTKTPTNYVTLKVKLIFDFVTSLLALIILAPVFILIGVIVKVSSKGPIFFSQPRVGLNGRAFHVRKFRTMVINAEELKKDLHHQNEQDGPVFKIKNDPRVTRIGKFLRKSSLDELPQLINVLRGEMSIVGPRPPVPEEVKKYERWQLRRLSMKPGITCIWQVSGRNNIPFVQWMKLDLQYIDTWSLKLDFVLILKTIGVVLRGDGQ